MSANRPTFVLIDAPHTWPSKEEPKHPDFRLMIKSKKKDKSGREVANQVSTNPEAGAAWFLKGGSIRLEIHAKVTLDPDPSVNYILVPFNKKHV